MDPLLYSYIMNCLMHSLSELLRNIAADKHASDCFLNKLLYNAENIYGCSASEIFHIIGYIEDVVPEDNLYLVSLRKLADLKLKDAERSERSMRKAAERNATEKEAKTQVPETCIQKFFDFLKTVCSPILTSKVIEYERQTYHMAKCTSAELRKMIAFIVKLDLDIDHCYPFMDDLKKFEQLVRKYETKTY